MGMLAKHPAASRPWRENVGWAVHNLIAHPLSEVVFWLGSERASNWIHDNTVPRHGAGAGRG